MSQTFAQYTISPRLGEIIDQKEREYFGLFPTIDGFVSATAFLEPDRQVKFSIVKAEHGVTTDTTFIIRPTVISYLVTYIDNYETTRDGTHRVSWDFLEGLAASSPVIENKVGKGIETTIMTLGGEQLHGKLLYADDSSLMLWQSSQEFNWQRVPASAKAVPPSEVNIIVLERSGNFWPGIGFGALTAAVLAATYGLVISGGEDLTKSTRLGPSHLEILGILTLFCGGVGAVIGGSVGAILNIDSHYTINGSMEEYLDALPHLKANAIFSSSPPPELIGFY